ncbi:hypothetical protein SAMN05421819_2737 [Bryocella elongata]|uniref:Adenylate cyclase n=1 Tax=Bryocella elongata TaxID=863522 RepID=A0A1H5ZP53_9BACT|nr:hypothetical protein [Bryocella elongata]SEG37176.1 hypothetical protein SAMN05421819_2737 [Bryocella elongata]
MIAPRTVAETPSVEQQRRQVERILASVTFRKSHKLASFLRFICEQTQKGKTSSIHEQNIGVEVFGRTEGYHIGEDSIVRSQARFLRLRLQEYYSTEGKEDAIVLTIPKGSYVPEFQFREPEVAATAGASAPIPVPSAVPVQVLAELEPEPGSRRHIYIRTAIAIGVGLVLCLAMIAGWRLRLADRAAAHVPLDQRFWASIFDPQRTTILVPADSSLVLMDEFIGREIQLPDYMTKHYRELTPPKGMEHLWQVLLTSQYTNVADLRMVSALQRIPEVDHSKTQIRFARDVSLSELKQNNVILIGSARANPWVDLFEPFGRFRVGYDPLTRVNMVQNRDPGPGEKSEYVEIGDDREHLAYGVVAYLPSLDTRSSSLLIGGTSKAGTEAAAEFLLSPDFLPFLKKISQEGRAIPHFELLLSAQNLNGTSYQSNVLCYHVLTGAPSSR